MLREKPAARACPKQLNRLTDAVISETRLPRFHTRLDDGTKESTTTLPGDTLAVGARDEDSASQGVGGNQADESAPESGAVYVFRRTGAVWEQEAYVKASNTGADDWFGTELALAGDTLAVGAI
jgi:hypothetical protein